MAKNLIPEIAKMLGVEMGEIFAMKADDSNMIFDEFMLDNHGLLYRPDEVIEWEIDAVFFTKLLNGELEVVKLPYKPKENEDYWTFTARLDCDGECTSQWALVQDIWYGCIDDYMRLKLGMVYRTEAEAEAALPAKYEEVTGKKWEADDEAK